ncbi:MAG: mRNA capping enzyme, partial [Satyrvirus sp.]
YHDLRRKYRTVRPSVYLIRHTIGEDKLDENEIYRRNKLEFLKVKDGKDKKILLVYKSPEKNFYPIYYQNIKYYDEDDESYLKNAYTVKDNIYFFDSKKIVNDLDILTALTSSLNRH